MDLIKFKDENNEERAVRLWVSYMEIYNEQINDLFDSQSVNLKVREDPNEGYFVAGLKLIRMETLEEVLKVLALGERSRKYRQTDIHEHSSRSHTVFRVLVENKI